MKATFEVVVRVSLAHDLAEPDAFLASDLVDAALAQVMRRSPMLEGFSVLYVVPALRHR